MLSCITLTKITAITGHYCVQWHFCICQKVFWSTLPVQTALSLFALMFIEGSLRIVHCLLFFKRSFLTFQSGLLSAVSLSYFTSRSLDNVENSLSPTQMKGSMCQTQQRNHKPKLSHPSRFHSRYLVLSLKVPFSSFCFPFVNTEMMWE